LSALGPLIPLALEASNNEDNGLRHPAFHLDQRNSQFLVEMAEVIVLIVPDATQGYISKTYSSRNAEN
jgi:hypothetical protein